MKGTRRKTKYLNTKNKTHGRKIRKHLSKQKKRTKHIKKTKQKRKTIKKRRKYGGMPGAPANPSGREQKNGALKQQKIVERR